MLDVLKESIKIKKTEINNNTTFWFTITRFFSSKIKPIGNFSLEGKRKIIKYEFFIGRKKKNNQVRVRKSKMIFFDTIQKPKFFP